MKSESTNNYKFQLAKQSWTWTFLRKKKKIITSGPELLSGVREIILPHDYAIKIHFTWYLFYP